MRGIPVKSLQRIVEKLAQMAMNDVPNAKRLKSIHALHQRSLLKCYNSGVSIVCIQISCKPMIHTQKHTTLELITSYVGLFTTIFYEEETLYTTAF